MDSRIQTLLTNSYSIGKLQDSQRLAVYTWLFAQFNGVPSDWSNIANWPNGLETGTPDTAINMQIYAMANAMGLPTDGAALAARVAASWGAGPIDAIIPVMLLNAQLKAFKAYT